MSYYNFTDLKNPRDLTKYTLMRGTTDFSNLKMFNNYEKGFPAYLIVVSVPEFLTKMAEEDSNVKNLLDQYVHILEYEFRGIDSAFENLSSDTAEVNNGNQAIQMITKTNGLTGGTFSMRYNEKSGTPITRMHELFLRSIRDPASGFKHYGGLIGNDSSAIYAPEDVGFHKECFSFLYMQPDNTGLALENAVYLIGCQPTTAELATLFNTERGTPEFVEISAEFNGFPIIGSAVNARAKELLDWLNSTSNTNAVVRDSWNFGYDAINNAASGLAQTKLTT